MPHLVPRLTLGLCLVLTGLAPACHQEDAASASTYALNEPTAVSCELHYFDSATFTKILNAAEGAANVGDLTRTPLVLTTPEGIVASIESYRPNTLSVGVSLGSEPLGRATYPLSSDPSGATDLQLPMPPVTKSGVIYDRVWVGCTPRAIAPPPGDRRASQEQSIETFVDQLAPATAWHDPVDTEAVKARERARIANGDGSDAPFFTAVWSALNAFPQGHQSLLSADPTVCGKAIPSQGSSRFGVCGRPSADGLLVTTARADNRLGLTAGDVVVSVDGVTGDEIFTQAYARPMCGAVFPSASGRRTAGAATFFGSVPSGARLEVRAQNGETRKVVVPTEADSHSVNCWDTFGRSTDFYAEASVRPDGVAVIRLPSFFPFDKSFPTNPSETEAFIAAYQAEIVKVFDTVKSAPAILWDARGNTGGITPVGLAIVGGFPSAKPTKLSYCATRIFGSNPPAYDGRYAEYEVTPGGPFAYHGKVAVLTDGLAYSAGDYFPLAAMKGGHAIVVGSSPAGAYGGGQGDLAITGPPALSASFDSAGCFDAETNQPLEAADLTPAVSVELDPKDVAAGRDTVLERAVKELGF